MSSRDDSGDLLKSLYEAGIEAGLAELRDRRPPRDDREFSLTEILEEMTLLLTDTSRHVAAGTPGGALRRAGDDATTRDRAKAIRGPKHIADLLAGWLIARADRATEEESVRAALEAAQGSPSEPELADALRGFVSGFLDGSIGYDAFARRLREPPASRRRQAVAVSAGDTAAPGVTVAEAGDRLRMMMSEAGLVDPSSDPLEAWRVFVRFAALPVAAEPQAELDPDDGDLLLFESGTEEIDGTRRPYVAFTRQFALRDPVEDEGIEQLRCTFWLEQAAAPPTEIVWSGLALPLSDWVRAVEVTEGFSMLATTRAVASEIQQDPV